MWWIIIIAIIVFILIMFINDTSQQSSKIKKEGGMRIKYRELISYMMSQDSRTRFFQETADSITLGLSNVDGKTLFILTQTFGKLTVQWKVDSNAFGRHSLEWDFPEYGDQEKMMNRIMNDIGKYQVNVMTAKGLF